MSHTVLVREEAQLGNDALAAESNSSTQTNATEAISVFDNQGRQSKCDEPQNSHGDNEMQLVDESSDVSCQISVGANLEQQSFEQSTVSNMDEANEDYPCLSASHDLSSSMSFHPGKSAKYALEIDQLPPVAREQMKELRLFFTSEFNMKRCGEPMKGQTFTKFRERIFCKITNGSVDVNLVYAIFPYIPGFLGFAIREGRSLSLELYNDENLLEKYHTYLRVSFMETIL